MTLSPRIYDSLPDYAPLLDQGLLAHFCDQGLQFALDYIYKALEELEYYFDPEEAIAILHTPIGGQFSTTNLDWLGNLVGLHTRGDHYLGTGINPNWTLAQKKYAILNAADYWQKKGSEPGIRKGIRIWTGWAGAEDSDRLKFVRPNGRGILRTGGLTWQYDTPLEAPKLKNFLEYPRLGGGDERPGRLVLPQERWEGGGVKRLTRSHLGSKNSWMVFEFQENQLEEWNQVFPEQLTLNSEIIPTRVTPVTIGKIVIKEDILVNWKNEPTLHDYSQWAIKIRSDRRTYRGQVFSSFWRRANGTRNSFSTATATDGASVGTLLIEIGFMPEPDDKELISLDIRLPDGDKVIFKSFSPHLQLDSRMVVLFSVEVSGTWEDIPFDDSAVSMSFLPPVLLAFRQFEIPVQVITDGQTVQWEQTRGPTVLITPNNEKSVVIERPNLNDDPYKIKATVQKKFRNGLIASRDEEVLIYTTPASNITVVCGGTGFAEIIEQLLFFNYWFLPLVGNSAIAVYREGGKAKIGWDVSGAMEFFSIVGFEWQIQQGDWVSSPVIANQQGKNYQLTVGAIARILCHVNENGALKYRATEFQEVPPFVILSQDSPVVKIGGEGIATMQEVFYSSSFSEDNLAVVTGTIGEGSVVETPYQFQWDEDNLAVVVGGHQDIISYQDFGLTVGGI